MQAASLQPGRRSRGFTLVEVMIVLVIVAILLLIALPGYQRQMQRTTRAMALATLETLRARQEQYFVNNRRYATDLTELGYPASPLVIDRTGAPVEDGTASPAYRVEIMEASATSFTLRAMAQGAQSTDSRCQVLALTALGVRRASPGDVGDCW